MRYRKLGNTGLKVSEVAFGGGAVGGLMTDNEREEEHLRVVRRALELGITHFDTAASYGDGRSEANLGRALEKAGAEVTLSTKVRLGAERLAERPRDIAGAVIASVEESLERLRRKSVDLIQLHDHVAPPDEWGDISISPEEVLGPGGVVDGFKSLKDKGKVRFFGFTGLGRPESLHALVMSGMLHTVQIYYNLLNPTAAYPAPEGFGALDYGGLLQKAAGQGMGVFAIRVLARGALVASPKIGGKEPRSLSPGSDYSRDVERGQKLAWLAEAEACSLSQAAFWFALMRPEFSAALAGCASVAEVEETAACSGAPGLSDESIKRLEGLWASDFA